MVIGVRTKGGIVIECPEIVIDILGGKRWKNKCQVQLKGKSEN